MRRFLIFLIFTITSVSLVGQNKFKPEWNIGLGFGPTIPSLSLEPAIRTKSEFRYHGGLAIRYISEKNLGLIGEINYTQQGWSQEFEKDTETVGKGYTHTHLLNYIEVPILTHIYFGNKVRFFFNLGPKMSFLVSEKETLSDQLAHYLDVTPQADRAFQSAQFRKDAERKFDYGLLVGGGMEFRSGIGHFALEGRYYLGLGDIYKIDKGTLDRSANRVISVKLTYYTKLF